MNRLIYKDGNVSQKGDVIKWGCEDNDDFTTWTFTGVIQQKGVLYLGGGIDFGAGIGQMLSFEEVVEQSEDNDPSFTGITYLGKVSDLVNHIKRFS